MHNQRTRRIYGMKISANARPQLKNAAAVMVTAELPPFAKPGQAIDITVASIGNAKSIRGGQLLMTPLRGADGNVYAIGQGSVVVGGISAQGKSGSSVQVNISASGRIPNGASVERTVPSSFSGGGNLTLNLNTADKHCECAWCNTDDRACGNGVATNDCVLLKQRTNEQATCDDGLLWVHDQNEVFGNDPGVRHCACDLAKVTEQRSKTTTSRRAKISDADQQTSRTARAGSS